MGFLVAFGDAGVIHIDGLFSQQGVPAFQRGFLLASQEKGSVTIPDDRVHVVLIKRL